MFNAKEVITNKNDVLGLGIQEISQNYETMQNIGLRKNPTALKKIKQSKSINELIELIRDYITESNIAYKYKKILLDKLSFISIYSDITIFKSDSNYSLNALCTFDESNIFNIVFIVDQDNVKVISNHACYGSTLIRNIEIKYNEDTYSIIDTTNEVVTKEKDGLLNVKEENNISVLKYTLDNICLKKQVTKNIQHYSHSNNIELDDKVFSKTIVESQEYCKTYNGQYVVGTIIKEDEINNAKDEKSFITINNCPSKVEIIPDTKKCYINSEEAKKYSLDTISDNINVDELSEEIDTKYKEFEKEYTFGFIEEQAKKAIKKYS